MTIRTTKPNATFIHIPKNAGTSISHWMINKVEGKWAYENHYGGKHWTLEQIKEVTDSDLGFTFCCVRNPWERLVSGFFYYKKQKKFNDRTFDEFIRQSNWHTLTKPQTAYFDDSTKILRFENLEEDFSAIQKFFNHESGLPKANKSQHDSYQKYYTDELAEIVAQRHKPDIEMFGYKFD